MVKVPRGEVRLEMEVAPRFDYGRARAHARVDRARRGVHEREDDAHAALDRAARGRARTTSSASSRCGAGDVGGFILESAVGDAAASRRRGGARRLLPFDGRRVAWLARGLDLPGSVARHGEPRRDHVEAAHVRADGCARRRRDDRPARAGGRRAQLGLPLHVAARRVVHRPGARPARVQVRRDRVPRPGCGTASSSTKMDENGPLRIMYRVDGSEDLEEYILDNFEGYMRFGAGPHRQRRVVAAPARHLRRDDGRDLARRARAAGDRAARVEGPRAA